MAENFAELRRAMVDSQIRTTDVTDLRLIEALLSVPREAFVPDPKKPFAYIDEDLELATDEGSPPRFMMEPSPFARLVQLAEVGPDDLVLDVGCANGYSSAVLSKLAGAVIALEEDAGLADRAIAILSELSFDSVAVVTGPLAAGYADEGPYDVIFVNGAVDFVAPALIEQLKPGGRLVAIEGEGLTGIARLIIKDDEGVVGSRTAFNAAVRPLPGFRKEAVFTF